MAETSDVAADQVNLKKATVTRAGNLIQVTPAWVNVLGPKLTYTRRDQERGRPVYTKVVCYREHAGGIVTPAGFTTRVCAALRKAGVHLTFKDLRDKKLPEPDFTRMDELRPGQEDAIAAAVAHDNGIIEAPTGVGKGFLIRQLCKIWPDSRIIICSYSVEIVRQIKNDLLEMFPCHEVGMVGGGHKANKARITCAVDKSLERCDLAHCDLFIYDEVHRAGAAETSKLIGLVRNAKMIGFSASPKGRSNNTDMEVEALFGPVVYRQDYKTAQASGNIVPIRVYVMDTTGCEDRQYQTTAGLERNLVWKSAERNGIIAASVDWIRRELKDPQILITVKTVTHAVNLGKILPDFELVYASMNRDDRDAWAKQGLIDKTKHPLTFERRSALYEGFRAGTVRRVIATGVWSTGVDFCGLNVLIRADAQSSSIANTQLPGRVSRVADGKDVGIIIDLNDVHNEILKNRALKRFALYCKKGWELLRLKGL